MSRYIYIPLTAIGSWMLANTAFADPMNTMSSPSAATISGNPATPIADPSIRTADGAGPGTAIAAPGSTPPTTATIKDADLGTSVIGRFFKYQVAEMGLAASPLATDPNAPPSRRPDWAPAPVTAPPYPFTEWSYGGTTLLGVNRPDSVDSPLMTAIADTGLGKAMSKAHIQVYGWVDVGGNISTSNVHEGNAPAAYYYDPNTVVLNQAVLYAERTPDTVQSDHVDWGFRVAGLYGTDYHYTASRGFLIDNNLYRKNAINGYDLPMIYGEIFIPKIAQGLMIRVGRYISLPDIEAQLAPNNYMYSHSLTYTFDNYTNEGVQLTLAATKNLFLQFGVSAGSDTALWNANKKLPNLYPNPLFPNSTFKRDPGAKLSVTGCIRYQTTSARDNIYVCADAINSGTWGYNNLQWFGLTYYHKFNDKFHVSFETYDLYQKNVLNLNNPAMYAAFEGGGTPFSPQYYPYNGPNAALCNNTVAISCTAHAYAALAYWNYQVGPLDNISLRTEYYNDEEGQRTGTKSRYYELGLGLQHWFSPQIEIRPEVAYYRSIDGAAFNIDSSTGNNLQAKNHQLVVAGDAIIHF